ncbi:hypothetical protein niasHT_039928 [Heterodera trifolii]|uniref:Uncharacterized protein n=1 Tax=Heterodera trifolii TaxID=157864 RepID=A0ABD2I7R4_9BILA
MLQMQKLFVKPLPGSFIDRLLTKPKDLRKYVGRGKAAAKKINKLEKKDSFKNQSKTDNLQQQQQQQHDPQTQPRRMSFGNALDAIRARTLSNNNSPAHPLFRESNELLLHQPSALDHLQKMNDVKCRTKKNGGNIGGHRKYFTMFEGGNEIDSDELKVEDELLPNEDKNESKESLRIN